MQHNSKCFDSQEQLPNFVHLLSRSIAIQQLRHVAEPDHRWTLLKKKCNPTESTASEQAVFANESRAASWSKRTCMECIDRPQTILQILHQISTVDENITKTHTALRLFGNVLHACLLIFGDLLPFFFQCLASSAVAIDLNRNPNGSCM